MKICHSEAMKRIKELEEQKNLLVYNESNRCTVSYKEGEEKTPSKYNYVKTRVEIEKIDKEVRAIKHALAVANSTIKVDDFDMTIGEALVYLAQLNAEYRRLDNLTDRDKLSRRITANGVIEYTECLYEPEKVEKDQKALYSKICKLQVAIDRANLNNYLDI
ncbi:MAG: hypothetical protein K2O39_05535 [Clostridiales bacterium]|nr:hypothetical protein [Clostridiales bacterium]